MVSAMPAMIINGMGDAGYAGPYNVGYPANHHQLYAPPSTLPYPPLQQVHFDMQTSTGSPGVTRGPGRGQNGKGAGRGHKQKNNQKSRNPRQTQCNNTFNVQLNAQICQIAENGSVWQLLELAQRSVNDMNDVNLSTFLQRLARRAKQTRTIQAVNRHQLLARVLTRVEAEVSAWEVALAQQTLVPQPRQWSTIAWSYATLQLHDKRIFVRVGKLALATLQEFKPMELSNLLWAFAKARIPVQGLFEAAMHRITSQLTGLTPVSLSAVAWSYASVMPQQAAGLLKAISSAFVEQMHQAQSQEIANMCWALATAKVVKPSIFKSLGSAALEKLQSFNIQELVNTLWSFSRAGLKHMELFQGVGALLSQNSRLVSSFHEQAQGLANTMWALAKQFQMAGHTLFPDIAVSLMFPCCRAVDRFKPQELSSVLWSVAMLGFRLGDNSCVDKLFLAAAEVAFPALRSFSAQGMTNILYAFTKHMNDSHVHVNFLGHLLSAMGDRIHEFNAKGLLYAVESSHELISKQAPVPGVIIFYLKMMCELLKSKRDLPPAALERLTLSTSDPSVYNIVANVIALRETPPGTQSPNGQQDSLSRLAQCLALPETISQRPSQTKSQRHPETMSQQPSGQRDDFDLKGRQQQPRVQVPVPVSSHRLQPQVEHVVEAYNSQTEEANLLAELPVVKSWQLQDQEAAEALKRPVPSRQRKIPSTTQEQATPMSVPTLTASQILSCRSDSRKVLGSANPVSEINSRPLDGMTQTTETSHSPEVVRVASVTPAPVTAASVSSTFVTVAPVTGHGTPAAPIPAHEAGRTGPPIPAHEGGLGRTGRASAMDSFLADASLGRIVTPECWEDGPLLEALRIVQAEQLNAQDSDSESEENVDTHADGLKQAPQVPAKASGVQRGDADSITEKVSSMRMGQNFYGQDEDYPDMDMLVGDCIALGRIRTPEYWGKQTGDAPAHPTNQPDASDEGQWSRKKSSVRPSPLLNTTPLRLRRFSQDENSLGKMIGIERIVEGDEESPKVSGNGSNRPSGWNTVERHSEERTTDVDEGHQTFQSFGSPQRLSWADETEKDDVDLAPLF